MNPFFDARSSFREFRQANPDASLRYMVARLTGYANEIDSGTRVPTDIKRLIDAATGHTDSADNPIWLVDEDPSRDPGLSIANQIWLGPTAEVRDLPLPDLIAVTLVRGASPDLESLNADLQALAPGTSVDDHQRWLADVSRLADLLQVLAILIVALVGVSAIVAVVFLTRTGLAVHQKVIELLHVIGAHDAYVARQFESHALRLGLRGGLVGCALAVVTLLAFGFWFESTSSEAMPRLSLSIFGWGSLLLLPGATALVAMVTARITVLRSLSRLP